MTKHVAHECRENRPAVDENGHALEWRKTPKEGCDEKDTVTEACRRVPHKYQTEYRTVEHIALFHYAVKSGEDFRIKLNRGNGFTRNWKFFRATDKCALFAIVSDSAAL